MVTRSHDDEQGRDRVGDAQHPHPLPVGQPVHGDAHPQRPADVHRRHGRVLVGVRRYPRVPPRAPRPIDHDRVDELTTRQQPRRGEGEEREAQQREAVHQVPRVAQPARIPAVAPVHPHPDRDRDHEVQRRVVVVAQVGEPFMLGHEMIERQLVVEAEQLFDVDDLIGVLDSLGLVGPDSVAHHGVEPVADEDEHYLVADQESGAAPQAALRRHVGPCRLHVPSGNVHARRHPIHRDTRCGPCAPPAGLLGTTWAYVVVRVALTNRAGLAGRG